MKCTVAWGQVVDPISKQLMSPGQRMKRYSHQGVMLGMIGHIPSNEADRQPSERRATVSQHVRYQRTQRVLSQ